MPVPHLRPSYQSPGLRSSEHRGTMYYCCTLWTGFYPPDLCLPTCKEFIVRYNIICCVSKHSYYYCTVFVDSFFPSRPSSVHIFVWMSAAWETMLEAALAWSSLMPSPSLVTSCDRPTRSTIEGERGCDIFPRLERERHENSPYRGHILPTSWWNELDSGQACRPCRGSCSPVPGSGCFDDFPGDGIVVSPPSPIVEKLSIFIVNIFGSFPGSIFRSLNPLCRRSCLHTAST